MSDHLRHIDIAPARLHRWREAAIALGDAGLTLRIELDAVSLDPSRHNLRRAARAARYIETITSGDQQQVANVTATELENDAS